MKTITSLKTARVQLLVIAVTAVLAQPLFAVPIGHTIQFTEISSSILTVTYDGLSAGITVTPTAPDRWTVDFPVQVMFANTTQAWFEPELNGTVNFVADSIIDHQVFVSSDRPFGEGTTPLLDNAPVQIGTDTSDNGMIFARFHDLGDGAAGVPEMGSSFVLLFLALTALLGANRSFRSA